MTSKYFVAKRKAPDRGNPAQLSFCVKPAFGPRRRSKEVASGPTRYGRILSY
ncbi:hypothetical protein ETB97_010198, partial [Aspergillus alliaceus]